MECLTYSSAADKGGIETDENDIEHEQQASGAHLPWSKKYLTRNFALTMPNYWDNTYTFSVEKSKVELRRLNKYAKVQNKCLKNEMICKFLFQADEKIFREGF